MESSHPLGANRAGMSPMYASGTGHKRSIQPQEIDLSSPPSVPKKPQDVSVRPPDSAVFISDDSDRQQLLAELREQSEGPVISLSGGQSLDDNQLLQQLTCPGEGEQKGKLLRNQGRLFSGQPMTLVLDLASLYQAGKSLAGLNDLLEDPPYCQGHPVSSAVRRVVLIDPDMLSPGLGKPGSDCWRRLWPLVKLPSQPAQSALEQPADSAHPITSNQTLLDQQVPPWPASGSLTGDSQLGLTLDFTSTRNWQSLLLGGLTLDHQGKAYFQPGTLQTLTPGQPLILQDAPWHDPAFTETLAKVLREGQFVANGRWLPLPDNLQLYRKQTSESELAALKARFLTSEGQPTADCVCLNQYSIDTALSHSRLQDGIPRPCNTLAELLGHRRQIVVTGPLSAHQWLRLLRTMETLSPPPTLVDGSDGHASLPNNNAVQCQRYYHEELALSLEQRHAEEEGKLVVYRVTAQDRWESLWQTTTMVSEEQFRFQQQDTELLTALKAGTPVVFQGLERAPQLLAQLESLLTEPAYLLVNGHRIDLPQARVTVLWPEQTPAPNRGPWQQPLQRAQPAQPQTLADQRLDMFLSLAKALPESADRTYPSAPPCQGRNFVTLLEQQLGAEQRRDRARRRLPVHYRKALHALLVKSYRGNREVYGYLKAQLLRLYPDHNPQPYPDRDALNDWLAEHPNPDRAVLKRHFWSLVRHCPQGLFAEQPQAFEPPSDDQLDLLAQCLVHCAPEAQQTELRRQLQINDQPRWDDWFSSRLHSTLRDALAAAGDRVEPGVHDSLYLLGQRLAHGIAQVLACDRTMNRTKAETVSRIRSCLVTFGFPENLLDGDFQDLPEALYEGRQNSRQRQQRRLGRLAEQVKQHPLLFLQGPPGAGKSYMAQAVAGELAQDPDWQGKSQPLVLSLGPNSSQEYLYGQQELKSYPQGHDQFSQFQPGPILAWAQDPNPPLLILDEANLAPEGLLAALAGLAEQPPRICFGGKVYWLTPKHRVVLTGNPDYYDGRRMDSTLQKVMVTRYYRPLPGELLREAVIQANLPEDWTDEQKHRAAEAVLCLYQQFKPLVADKLSPRDLQDVLARINQAERHSHQRPAEVFAFHNTLVWNAFEESLVGALGPAFGPRLEALKDWYQSRFPMLPTREYDPKAQAFSNFLQQLQRQYSPPEMDLHSGPVVDLIRHYWLFLDKQQDHPVGKRCLVVEGPAGWGKDRLLRCVLTLWEQQQPPAKGFTTITAHPEQWETLVKTVTTAMESGQKLVISELNLLPSRYLEGLFNEVLGGEKQPGFILFATINPPVFQGREQLSEALVNRSTRVVLQPLSFEHLRQILNRRYPSQTKMIHWLMPRYQALSNQLVAKKSPIQLTLNTLFQGADALYFQDPAQWPEIFVQIYGLALKAINSSFDSLAVSFSEPTAPMDDGRLDRQRALSQAINKQTAAPVIIRLTEPGQPLAFDPHRGLVSLPDSNDFERLREQARYLLFDSQHSPDSVGHPYNSLHSYQLHQYFAGDTFKTRDYRLTVYNAVVVNNRLAYQPVAIDSAQIDILDMPGGYGDKRILRADEQFGYVTLELKGSDWVSLPGLSAADRPVALKCNQSVPLNLGRSRQTGQLMIRRDPKTTDPTSEQSVTVTFIIRPDSDYLQGLAGLSSSDSIQLMPERLDKSIRSDLEHYVFGWRGDNFPACRALQRIKQLAPTDQLHQLAGWCSEFRRDQAGQGLISAIRHKTGACAVRSQVFQLLSHYFGIPARLVDNGSHQFVEVSLDRGRHWRKIDLGGAGNVTKQIIAPNFPRDVVLPVSGQKGTGGSQYVPNDRITVVCRKVSDSPQWLEEFARVVAESKRFLYCLGCLLDDGPTLAHYPDLMVKLWRWLSQQDSLSDTYITKMADSCSWYFYHTGKCPDSFFRSLFPAIQCGDFPAANILQVLHSYADDLALGAEVNTILDNVYQQLVQPQTWDSSWLDLLKPLPFDDLGGQSPTLLREITRTALQTRWSRVSTGQPPDFNRMAKKQAPFSMRGECLEYRTIICPASFPDKIVLDLCCEYLGVVQGGYEVLNSATLAIFDRICRSFVAWLLQQAGGNIYFLIKGGMCMFDRRMGGESPHITPGLYPAIDSIERQLYLLRMITTNHGLNEPILALDRRRIHNSLNRSSVCVLTHELLITAFREFLQSMDWSLLPGVGETMT